MSTTKQRLGAQRYRFKPFEDESHLECICRLQVRDRDVGAYLLNCRNQLSFVFGFRAVGIHTLLADGQAETVLARLESGLQGFRPGDRLRIHLRSIGTDYQRQQELSDRIESTSTLESQFLLLAQQRATRDRTAAGQRQPKHLYLFATYGLEPGKEARSDRLEQALAWIVSRYDTFKGLKQEKESQHYQQLLNQAFTDGYLHWEQQLNSRMGLQASPLDADVLWDYLWHQFNQSASPPVPQCLTLSDQTGQLSLRAC